MRPFRCVKCGGPHNTTTCTKDNNFPATCALCQGSHPANYKGCQVYREIYARKTLSKYRNENSKTEQKQSNIPTLDIDKWMPLVEGPKTTSPSKTYREALKGETKEYSKGRNEQVKETSLLHTAQSLQPDSHTHIKNENILLEIVIKQTQKIDLLIQQMGTLINLMTTLISKK